MKMLLSIVKKLFGSNGKEFPVRKTINVKSWLRNRKVDICVATVKELTGKDTATTAEIVEAIKLVGHLCSSDVVGTLAGQYGDEYWCKGIEIPKCERCIATEPTETRSGSHLFEWCHVEGGYSLVDIERFYQFWDGGRTIVFVRK
jgi:hypothetical protein